MKKYVEKFQSLEKGKKIKLVIVIILLIIVLYALSGLFSSNNASSYTPVNHQAQASPQAAQPQLVAHVVQKKSVAKPDIVLNNLNEKQMAYLKAVNDLQMLQLQQQIAQTKQQIAQAELQAAQSNKQLQAIIAPPPSPLFQNTEQNQPPQAMQTTIVPPPSDYKLEYLANEGGKWQVILSSNGALINGTMGTVLPDGSTITNISGNSVTLTLDNRTRVLMITQSF